MVRSEPLQQSSQQLQPIILDADACGAEGPQYDPNSFRIEPISSQLEGIGFGGSQDPAFGVGPDALPSDPPSQLPGGSQLPVFDSQTLMQMPFSFGQSFPPSQQPIVQLGPRASQSEKDEGTVGALIVPPSPGTAAAAAAALAYVQMPNFPGPSYSDAQAAAPPPIPLPPVQTQQQLQMQQIQLQQLQQLSERKMMHPSLLKPEHRNSRATRRGPMDEMRQLIRILVKLMPDSLRLLTIGEENGGGNRVSEEQIKSYIKHALGPEPPQPEWGLPSGWGEYLAQLFSWVLDRDITRDEAMNCARRLPGRSWETVDSELVKLGVFPASWPLPLTLEGVQAANRAQAARPRPRIGRAAAGHPSALAPLSIVTAPSSATAALAAAAALAESSMPKGAEAGYMQMPRGPMNEADEEVAAAALLMHQGEAAEETMLQRLSQAKRLYGKTDDGMEDGKQQKRKRAGSLASASRSSLGIDAEEVLTELDCWHLAHKYAQEAMLRADTTPPEHIADLNSTRDAVRRLAGPPVSLPHALTAHHPLATHHLGFMHAPGTATASNHSMAHGLAGHHQNFGFHSLDNSAAATHSMACHQMLLGGHLGLPSSQAAALASVIDSGSHALHLPQHQQQQLYEAAAVAAAVNAAAAAAAHGEADTAFHGGNIGNSCVPNMLMHGHSAPSASGTAGGCSSAAANIAACSWQQQAVSAAVLGSASTGHGSCAILKPQALKATTPRANSVANSSIAQFERPPSRSGAVQQPEGEEQSRVGSLGSRFTPFGGGLGGGLTNGHVSGPLHGSSSALGLGFPVGQVNTGMGLAGALASAGRGSGSHASAGAVAAEAEAAELQAVVQSSKAAAAEAAEAAAAEVLQGLSSRSSSAPAISIHLAGRAPGRGFIKPTSTPKALQATADPLNGTTGSAPWGAVHVPTARRTSAATGTRSDSTGPSSSREAMEASSGKALGAAGASTHPHMLMDAEVVAVAAEVEAGRSEERAAGLAAGLRSPQATGSDRGPQQGHQVASAIISAAASFISSDIMLQIAPLRHSAAVALPAERSAAQPNSPPPAAKQLTAALGVVEAVPGRQTKRVSTTFSGRHDSASPSLPPLSQGAAGVANETPPSSAAAKAAATAAASPMASAAQAAAAAAAGDAAGGDNVGALVGALKRKRSAAQRRGSSIGSGSMAAGSNGDMAAYMGPDPLVAEVG